MTVFEEIVDFFWGKKDIERHNNSSHRDSGKVYESPFTTVFREESDFVSFCNPQSLEASNEGCSTLFDVRIVHTLKRPRARTDESNMAFECIINRGYKCLKISNIL